MFAAVSALGVARRSPKLQRQKGQPDLNVDGNSAGDNQDGQKGGGRKISSVGGAAGGHCYFFVASV